MIGNYTFKYKKLRTTSIRDMNYGEIAVTDCGDLIQCVKIDYVDDCGCLVGSCKLIVTIANMNGGSTSNYRTFQSQTVTLIKGLKLKIKKGAIFYGR